VYGYISGLSFEQVTLWIVIEVNIGLWIFTEDIDDYTEDHRR